MSMILKKYFPLLLILPFLGFSQNFDYSCLSLSDTLTTNANAIIRKSNTTITISNYNEMTESINRVVTVLNSKGNRSIDAYVFYDNTTKIKKLEATIYNKFGKEIKRIKKNGFKDVSAVSNGTLYSDDRVKHLQYTPIEYPYTVEFNSEVESTTTAFIRPWLPLEDYYVSTAFSEYKIINTSGINLKTKKSNFDNYNINEVSNLNFEAKNLKALEAEEYNIGFKNLVPYLRFALEEFDMKGVKGTNKNWVDFGKWINDVLIDDTRNLPENVIDEVKSLIPNNATDLDKMKIVYKYMQDKTRYISVQVGIGGWRPIIAQDVDRLGYGDCKGLSNYTKALLEAVGIPSYYAVIYGGRSIKSFDKEFSATEGNHAVLAIPYQEDYIWLECTSQTSPFGYIANFTDDRDALLITPEGGKIVHTKSYTTSDNLTKTNAEIELFLDGHISGIVNITTKGSRYYYHSRIEDKSLKDQKLTYKESYWDDINRLEIEAIELSNDRNEITFTENVKLRADKYVKATGGRLLFTSNFFNRLSYIPPKNRNRISDIKIDRGYTDKDEYILKIPETTSVEAIPRPVEISTEFGTYKYQVTQKEDTVISIKRELVINNGIFKASEYNNYRNFIKSIAKADRSKIALKIN